MINSKTKARKSPLSDSFNKAAEYNGASEIMLSDNFELEKHREISLRVAVTQKCNNKCVFCFREGYQDGQNNYLDSTMLLHAIKYADECNIKRLRFTGGEPLLRKDLSELIKSVTNNSSLQVGVTTNGTLLRDKAKLLREAGLDSINISVPSISRQNYKRITGSDSLSEVKDGLKAAIDCSFSEIKINVPVIGINVHEIPEVISVFLALPHVRVRFFSILQYHNCDSYLPVSTEVIIRNINSAFNLNPQLVSDGSAHRVTVRPHRHPNCTLCSECKYNGICSENAVSLRLTCDGYLHPCLLNDNLKVDFTSLSKESFVKGYNLAKHLYDSEYKC